MKNLYLSILCVSLALFTACNTTSRVSSEHNPDVDFTNYKSFFILPLPSKIPGADPGLMLRYGRAAREGIDEALKTKGFTSGSSIESTDFSVNVTGNVMPKTRVRDYGMTPIYTSGLGYSHGSDYWGSGFAMGGMDVDQYNEGTLILEIYDNKSKEIVWVGWTTQRQKSGVRTDEEVKAYIANIFTDLDAVLLK